MKISFILFAIMGFAYPAFSHDFDDTSTKILQPELAEEICYSVDDSGSLRRRCLRVFAENKLSKHATEVCGNMWNSSTVVRCLNNIAGKNFSKYGTDICESLRTKITNDEDPIRCLEVIAGKSLPEKEAQICRNKTSTDEVIECLKEVAINPLPSLTDTLSQELGEQICDNNVGYNYRRQCLRIIAEKIISKHAALVCKNMYSAGTAYICLSDMAGKSFSKYGTDVCESLRKEITHDGPPLRCLEVIAGKIISQEEAQICKNKTSTDEVLKCLRNFATDPSDLLCTEPLNSNNEAYYLYSED